MIYLLLFIFGAVFGSFLNVVILRSLIGESTAGRSYCPSCKRTLSPQDLVPILSFIFLRGRCRTCKAPISTQYPVVELVTGFLLMLAYPNFLLFVSVCLLLVLLVIDLKSFLLPDFFIVLLGVLAFIGGSVSLSGMLVGSGFLLFLWLITRGKGIGFGDVKLLIPLGLMTGASGSVAILATSFTTGAIVGLGLIALGRASRKTAIPFGPFLAISGIVVLLFPSIATAVWDALFPWASALK